jgi:hypothetical protein
MSVMLGEYAFRQVYNIFPSIRGRNRDVVLCVDLYEGNIGNLMFRRYIAKEMYLVMDEQSHGNDEGHSSHLFFNRIYIG